MVAISLRCWVTGHGVFSAEVRVSVNVITLSLVVPLSCMHYSLLPNVWRKPFRCSVCVCVCVHVLV